MGIVRVLFFFFTFVSTLSAPVSAGPILVATVAQVRDHVITTREVQIHYVLDRLLGLEPYGDNRKNPVGEIIHEWLLLFESRDFYGDKSAGVSYKKSVKALKAKLPSVEGWEKLQVSSSELEGYVKRKLEAYRLYSFKKKASELPVSDAEVEIEYKQNRVRYGSRTLDEVREEIRQRKFKENFQTRLGNWFAVLEKKYRVQRFAEYKKK